MKASKSRWYLATGTIFLGCLVFASASARAEHGLAQDGSVPATPFEVLITANTALVSALLASSAGQDWTRSINGFCNSPRSPDSMCVATVEAERADGQGKFTYDITVESNPANPDLLSTVSGSCVDGISTSTTALSAKLVNSFPLGVLGRHNLTVNVMGGNSTVCGADANFEVFLTALGPFDVAPGDVDVMTASGLGIYRDAEASQDAAIARFETVIESNGATDAFRTMMTLRFPSSSGVRIGEEKCDGTITTDADGNTNLAGTCRYFGTLPADFEE